MNRDRSYDLRVGEAAMRLTNNDNFLIFMEEIGRRRELIVHQTMYGKCENYEEYLAARGSYLAFSEVLRAPGELSDVARDIREQSDDSN